MFSMVTRLLGKNEPSIETAIYQREWAVYQALNEILPNQGCIIGGRYDWLTSPLSGHPLQIDIFYPMIKKLAGVDLASPQPLAVEVQSSLHDGKWARSKRLFFRNKAEFEHYTKNQEFKRKQIMAHSIPFLEIDPSKDDLSPANLRRLIGATFGMRF